MKRTSMYTRKRNSHPSDRHKRPIAYRHTPYHKRAAVQKTAAAAEPVVQEIKPTVEIQTVQTPAITAEETVKERLTLKERYQRRKQRIQDSRIAEIDAIIGKNRNSLLDLLIHPYKCMVNDGTQEICSSSVSSLVRLMFTWIVISTVLAMTVRQVIETQSFSFIRFNFTNTSNFAFRILLLTMLCEALSASVNVVLARLGGNHVSFKRVLATRSGCWLFQLIGVLLGVFVSRYYMTIGVCIIFAFVFMGVSLNNHAQSEALQIQIELQSVITVINLFLCSYLVLQWMTFIEKPLIAILLQIYNKS